MFERHRIQKRNRPDPVPQPRSSPWGKRIVWGGSKSSHSKDGARQLPPAPPPSPSPPLSEEEAVGRVEGIYTRGDPLPDQSAMFGRHVERKRNEPDQVPQPRSSPWGKRIVWGSRPSPPPFSEAAAATTEAVEGEGEGSATEKAESPPSASTSSSSAKLALRFPCEATIRENLGSVLEIAAEKGEAIRGRLLKETPDWGRRLMDTAFLQWCRALDAHLVGFSYLSHLIGTKELNPGSLKAGTELCYSWHVKRDKAEAAPDCRSIAEGLLKELEGEWSLPALSESRTLAGCVAGRWKELLPLFEEEESWELNGPLASLHHRSAVIQEAFGAGDGEAGWDLVEKCRPVEGGPPRRGRHVLAVSPASLSAILAFLKGRVGEPDFLEHWRKFVEMQRENAVALSEELAEEIRGVFSLRPDFEARYVDVPIQPSKCSGCGARLDQYKITRKEFEDLKTSVWDFLTTSDKYHASTPRELDQFAKWIDSEIRLNGPFDVVVDGLNVFLLQPPRNFTRLVSLVKALKSDGEFQRVLVVARRHLRVSHFRELEDLKKLADVTLLDDRSLDDPFFLYASLKCGINTYLVSNDLLGDLKARFTERGKPEVSQTLEVFQRVRQINLQPYPWKSEVRIVYPMNHGFLVQGSPEKGWHFPFRRPLPADPTSRPFQPLATELQNTHGWLCVAPPSAEKF